MLSTRVLLSPYEKNTRRLSPPFARHDKKYLTVLERQLRGKDSVCKKTKKGEKDGLIAVISISVAKPSKYLSRISLEGGGGGRISDKLFGFYVSTRSPLRGRMKNRGIKIELRESHLFSWTFPLALEIRGDSAYRSLWDS